jgi:hypothetical protein
MPISIIQLTNNNYYYGSLEIVHASTSCLGDGLAQLGNLHRACDLAPEAAGSAFDEVVGPHIDSARV